MVDWNGTNEIDLYYPVKEFFIRVLETSATHYDRFVIFPRFMLVVVKVVQVADDSVTCFACVEMNSDAFSIRCTQAYLLKTVLF